MYCRPKFLGINTTTQSDLLSFMQLLITNMHCFWAVVEIPCSGKSTMSKTSNFGFLFLRFFKMPLQKKRKKSRFLDFQKNVKNVFSNYDL